MFYDQIVSKITEVIDDVDISIPDHYESMTAEEKLVFLCYEFYHMGYEDGKADRNIGSCICEH